MKVLTKYQEECTTGCGYRKGRCCVHPASKWRVTFEFDDEPDQCAALSFPEWCPLPEAQ